MAATRLACKQLIAYRDIATGRDVDGGSLAGYAAARSLRRDLAALRAAWLDARTAGGDDDGQDVSRGMP